VAEIDAAEVLAETNAGCRQGCIPPRGGDGGVDFVGRLDDGRRFGQARVAVLGYAKCEKGAANAQDVARTVARLRRGWLGRT
jgi:hypothetical protein